MVIIDELAYIDQGLWDETIRALLNMKNAGLIGITTPRGPDNFVSLLINMENDDGTPFFNVLHMTTVCEACKLLPTKSEQLACNHSWIPTYKSREKQTRNAKVAEATGSIGITLQEDCGVFVAGTDGAIFDPQQLKEVFDTKNPALVFGSDRRDLDFVPDRIYLMSDPNADGPSFTTAMSCFWAPERKDGGFPRLVVLGIDARQTTGSNQKDDLILRHLKHIRGTKKYSKVPIIFVPENNTGSYATHMETTVRLIPSVTVLKQGGPNAAQPGVRLNDVVKADYVYTIQTLMDNAQIVWSSELFTLSLELATRLRSTGGARKSNVEVVMGELFLQMCRMRYLKDKITGKVGPYQDDLAITLFMCGYWSKAVENLSSPTYKYYRSLVWTENIVQPTARYLTYK